jgi:hypothetical protein
MHTRREGLSAHSGYKNATNTELLLTLREHLGSSPVFSGICVANLFSFLCCVVFGFFLCDVFVFVLCLVCPMLPVSLDCPFLIGLLCAQCCQCLLIVHSWLPICAFLTFIYLLLLILNERSMLLINSLAWPHYFNERGGLWLA